MNRLGDLPLTSVWVIAGAAALTLLSVVLAALVLPRGRRGVQAGGGAVRAGARSGRRHGLGRRLWQGCWRGVLVVLLPSLLALGTGALAMNRSGQYVPTLSSLLSIATSSGSVTGKVTSLADAESLDAVPASAWKASFSKHDDGSYVATWKGPVSGIELPVRVVVPSGYSPDDGRTYDVIEGLHGYPGDPSSFSTGMDVSQILQEAIDAGRIPPSIMVMPSLNPDGRQHDCANVSGRPAVATWVAQEVPRMVEATFPNVTRDRQGWMLMGLSSGAYCAGWLGMSEAEQYGSVGVLSGYDRPAEGSLAHGGDAAADANTLSTMLKNRTGGPALRFYVMGSQDDPYFAALTAWRMEAAVGPGDSVTSDTPVTGGHTWALWSAHVPTLLQWWGKDPAVFQAAGLSGPTSGDSSSVTPVVTTPASQRTGAAVAQARNGSVLDPGGVVTLGGCVLGCLLAVGALLRWGSRGRGVGALVARVVAVLVVACCLAATVGLVGNALTGFATSWKDLGGIVSAAVHLR